MEEAAGWIAPIATMVAAMMTASNLGPRFTGWGFVVFTVGSLAWSWVAISTDQTNLLWTNAFLTLVNVVGIWRWLGRQARFGDGARAAEAGSKRRPGDDLFSVGAIADGPIRTGGGEVVAHGIDAMAECGSGRIAYLMVREGGTAGLGERLHALSWEDVRRQGDGFVTRLSEDQLRALPVVQDKEWPSQAPR